MSFTAVIVAAGSGTRSGGPKQWRQLAGRPVIRWSVEAFLQTGAKAVIVVIPHGESGRLGAALEGLEGWRAVVGGAERAASVRLGLSQADPALPVLIHDAARPLVTAAHIQALLAGLARADAAAPALPVADTLKSAEDGVVGATVDRTGLWRVQTPQAFAPGVLQAAFEAWTGDGSPTDDLAVVEATGRPVHLIQGDLRLMKLTFPEDFDMAEALIGTRTVSRVGTGFDVHTFGPGSSVWLCGIEIPHSHGLVGHSDADCGLHALTDAILGAIGAGDIGDHFPPTDPQWKGASSDRFLTHAAELVAHRGGRIVHVDVTLICERPKVKPHRQAMRERIAEILALPLDSVSVKATTTEGLGFTGRSEGLAAQAVATIETPG
ncbi:MAG TPA: bifunctional 2-C-methyl-D-erythritol 4-phosphate cytidylyltransferase/2-C-methyl-D-erythritol 2,4-cyclodiphosphate synthase [Brevundimonas sp.]|uniref:bifunctional 2-C-methyl-D-erythritol 4-phosphate cytidylyltransferase/2-C-methyl-D-erythritol 2,4-cyclodiphosphate synthase n=1 Tax=Brevundimonas sp. TaxID=1871086 RepID=UPI002BDB0F68|nr:bifunctional 2-C-methyl-D-erythritol 4-phosphate cytidylyltransferase/2-C-methyl-D-erythritol 2,4-cyclodiphosphate synthase [Brevundimonas sp.]HRH19394.1 bifunctional 2-C-methyl-D-erythritol 4-phosphate cytidylyltransferase/2-C-methyl-D-erythritol 2,4-cyclodiphosphate synthase [Brevundimonas sp.]